MVTKQPNNKIRTVRNLSEETIKRLNEQNRIGQKPVSTPFRRKERKIFTFSKS